MNERVTAQYPFYCSMKVQLRFNDIDMVGHINNSVYFELFDLAKSDYFSRVRHKELEWTSIPVMVVNINCNFYTQTFFNEPLEVRTQTEKIGNKSFTLLQQLVNIDTGEVKCECRSTMVYIDLSSFTPSRVAQDWRDAMVDFEQREM